MTHLTSLIIKLKNRIGSFQISEKDINALLAIIEKQNEALNRIMKVGCKSQFNSDEAMIAYEVLAEVEEFVKDT